MWQPNPDPDDTRVCKTCDSEQRYGARVVKWPLLGKPDEPRITAELDFECGHKLAWTIFRKDLLDNNALAQKVLLLNDWNVWEWADLILNQWESARRSMEDMAANHERG